MIYANDFEADFEERGGGSKADFQQLFKGISGEFCERSRTKREDMMEISRLIRKL
jgi:hypothetical protein